jgi:hypothetical protein
MKLAPISGSGVETTRSARLCIVVREPLIVHGVADVARLFVSD